MPLAIKDRNLSTLYSTLERQRASNPSVKIGSGQVLQLLAEVADAGSKNGEQLLQSLKAPGLTRAKQVELIQKGMTAAEKKDLTAILDKGSVPMDADAKAFISAVLGRGSVPAGPALQVTGDQRTGLHGTAKPGATIEAINLSAAPEGRLHLDDTVAIGKADANGAFSNAKLTGEQAIKQGDLIRLRARYADGSTSDWLTVAATGVGTKDTRNALVAMSRIGLADAGGGSINLSNNNASRPISEPGAKLQFVNKRSGEKVVVTLTAAGDFPANTKLQGRPGDTFSVAASDGTNNTSFSTTVGNVTVPGAASGADLIADPVLHHDELNADGTPQFNKARFKGPLFQGTVAPGDVRQGALANCYFPGAMAALAHTNPDVIRNMVKDNGDGTYTVTFRQMDWTTRKYKDVPIKVDGDLYVKADGSPVYGRGGNGGNPPGSMELWYPLIEKAYAAWSGAAGYNGIGNGGVASSVFEYVLGRPTTITRLKPTNLDAVWKTLTTSLDAKTPVAVGTHGEDQESLYVNTGIYADHTYSVLGYQTVGNQRFVTLRNPWGESEPAGNGADDGVFTLKFEDFSRLFANMMHVK